MKIVIELDGRDYQFIKGTEFKNFIVTEHLYEAVDGGTPLPKGHGRLIDGDYLYKRFVANKCPDSLVLQYVREEPTIIEADEEKANEENYN